MLVEDIPTVPSPAQVNLAVPATMMRPAALSALHLYS